MQQYATVCDQAVALTCKERTRHASGHDRPTFPRKHGSQGAEHPSNALTAWCGLRLLEGASSDRVGTVLDLAPL